MVVSCERIGSHPTSPITFATQILDGIVKEIPVDGKLSAVASAIPPNTNAISIGIPAIRNTTEKTAETTKNVPIDCTKVMPMICLPELAIFLN